MPQGKLRAKTKLPTNVVGRKAKSKGPAVSRKSRPITPKKKATQEAQKIKKVITKNVNEAIETELRSRASDGQKAKLSAKKKQPKTPKGKAKK